MKLEKTKHYHWGMHADHEDLAGEHKAGDAGQVILGIIFLAVWILDSFVLKYSTFLADKVAWYFRIIPAIILLIISGYLARAGLRIVFGEKRETPGVISKGVFSIVRHPVYLGCILFYPGLICFTFSLSSVAVWIVIILFYWFISRHEEKLLLQKFGKEYENYMSKVPMLLPVRLKR